MLLVSAPQQSHAVFLWSDLGLSLRIHCKLTDPPPPPLRARPPVTAVIFPPHVPPSGPLTSTDGRVTVLSSIDGGQQVSRCPTAGPLCLRCRDSRAVTRQRHANGAVSLWATFAVSGKLKTFLFSQYFHPN